MARSVALRIGLAFVFKRLVMKAALSNRVDECFGVRIGGNRGISGRCVGQAACRGGARSSAKRRQASQNVGSRRSFDAQRPARGGDGGLDTSQDLACTPARRIRKWTDGTAARRPLRQKRRNTTRNSLTPQSQSRRETHSPPAFTESAAPPKLNWSAWTEQLPLLKSAQWLDLRENASERSLRPLLGWGERYRSRPPA